METTTQEATMTEAQRAARSAIASKSEFDGFVTALDYGGENGYDAGAGHRVFVWYTDEGEMIETDVSPTGATSSRAIWTD